MGRGRQKAKHTKIARELKSFSPNVDYNQLERELTTHGAVDEQYAAEAAKWDEYADEPVREPDAYVPEDEQKRA